MRLGCGKRFGLMLTSANAKDENVERPAEIPSVKKMNIPRSFLVTMLLLTWSLSSAGQNNCSTQPPLGTCPAPASPVVAWCAGNNSNSTCPGGTSWVAFYTSPPATGSWSGQFEGLDAASLLGAGLVPGPQADPNGAVGPTNATGVGQYLEFSNYTVQAFDRATGNGIFSNRPNSGGVPQPLASMFAPHGSAYCGNESLDGLATYDRIDGVFVLADLFNPGGTGGYYFCIGVSAPSGAVPANNLQGYNNQSYWNVYAYNLTPAIPVNSEGRVYFPDYARFGTWKDGFYVTWDLLDLSQNDDIVGFEVCQLDKTNMIAGLVPNQPVCYTYIPSYAGGPGGTDKSLIHTLLPADFEGNNPIPSTTAGEYFLAQVNPSNAGTNNPCTVAPCISDQLAFWTWSGFQTGSGPTYLVPKTSYIPGCYAPHSPYVTQCVWEPYGGVIDSVGDRLMQRLAYRYISGTQKKEYLAVASTVQAHYGSKRTAIRYYKIQAGATASVLLSGTLQDTANFYYLSLPSVAMDSAGNLGITYTVTGSTSHGSLNNYDPSPFFVTVGSNGAHGTPVAILSNSGSSGQDETDTSWGEYVSVSSDPNDDLTFWAVDEYMNGDQTGNCLYHPKVGTGCTWATRIFTCKKGAGC